jgi:hypothetical protein
MSTKVVHRKLGRERINKKGIWAYADTDNNEVHLDTRLKGKMHMRYAIHEKYHIQFPDMKETDVRKYAKEMQMYLSDLGYTKTNP